MAQEHQVLGHQRLVQAQMLARLRDDIGRGIGRQQQRERIAGQARDQEDDHARAQYADQSVQQAFRDRHDRLREDDASRGGPRLLRGRRGGGSAPEVSAEDQRCFQLTSWNERQ
ncbi:hypothetical protein D9M68_848020 [compost metagenome]